MILIVSLTTPAFAEPAAETQRAAYALDRIGFGPAGTETLQVAQMGVDQYVEQQLYPERIPLPAALEQQLDSFTTLKESPYSLFVKWRQLKQDEKNIPKGDDEKKALKQEQANPLREARDAKLLRAIESPRQLQEALVDFWFNHFNVYDHKGVDEIFVGLYEEQAIRPYVLGHFRDMLEATAKHPAMLFYLDNWKSVAPNDKKRGEKVTKQGTEAEEGINENYAREVMELHTLGVDGGYSQTDVTQLARILTGWGFGMAKINRPKNAFFNSPSVKKEDNEQQQAAGQSVFYFNPERHDTGVKIFLGHQFQPSGEAEGEAALDMLAYSPVTARHLSYELAQYFVSDDPPKSLVDRMTARWMQTKGDLREVTRTMLRSPEFWDVTYRGTKYRSPFQYVVAAVRASGASVDPEVLSAHLAKMGEEPYGCLTPDGYKNTEQAWLNPSGTEARLNFALALGSGHMPQIHVDHPAGGLAVKSKDDGPPQTLNVAQIESTLTGQLSTNSLNAIANAAPQLQPSLALGAPEMMRR